MRVKSEDILKPGAKLETRLIDFNDPEVKKLIAYSKREQRKLRRMSEWTQEKQDMLSLVITI